MPRVAITLYARDALIPTGFPPVPIYTAVTTDAQTVEDLMTPEGAFIEEVLQKLRPLDSDLLTYLNAAISRSREPSEPADEHEKMLVELAAATNRFKTAVPTADFHLHVEHEF